MDWVNLSWSDEKTSMDDDEYQRIVDYENEIYDLNHVEDRKEAEENPDDEGESASGSYDDENIESENFHGSRGHKNTKSVNDDEQIEQMDTDSGDLSEDERDQIYAQLYHGASNMAVNGESANLTKKMSSGRKPNGVTLELDFDKISSPLTKRTPPIIETATLDEDGDFSVTFLSDQLTFEFGNRGRYFAPPELETPPPPIVCFRCNQPGHMKSDCPHRICIHCSAIDDHPNHKCPTRQYCQNCTQRGHTKTACPFPQHYDSNRPCGMCGDYGHVSATCHQIWRFYRPIEPTKLKPIHEIERYCYNCSLSGHLGDDCRWSRPLYVQGGKIGVVASAFGEGNVPAWVNKPVIPNEKSMRMKRTHVEEEEWDEDDGWFGDRARSPPPLAKRIGGIKLNRMSQQDASTNVAEVRRRPPLPDEPPPRRHPVVSRNRPPSRESRSSTAPTADSYRPRYSYPNKRSRNSKMEHGRRGDADIRERR